MTESRRKWMGPLARMALVLGACGMACAQQDAARSRPLRSVEIKNSAWGALAGQLTDLHSVPLAGVEVVARNRATGAAARTTTAKNGSFRFAALEAGEYALEAEAPQFGWGSLEGIVVTGGSEARVQAAMAFKPALPQPMEAGLTVRVEAAAAPVLLKLRAHEAADLERPRIAMATVSAGDRMRLEPRRMEGLPLTGRAGSIQPEAISLRAILEDAERARVPVETETAATDPALAAARLRTFSFGLHAAATPEAPAATRAVSRIAASLETDSIADAAAVTLTGAQLQELPVSGRRWEEILQVEPAASAVPAAAQLLLGTAQETGTVTVDGESAQIAFGTTAGADAPSVDAGIENAEERGQARETWTAGHSFGVSETAVSEVTVADGSAGAERMDRGGGAVEIRTAKGSNALHGQAFLNDRQNAWGAQNPYTEWVRNAGSAAAPEFQAEPFTAPDREIVWGIGLGSRIRRDKLFWFASLDGNRRNDPGVAMVRHPEDFFYIPEPTSDRVQLLSAQLGEGQNQAYNDYLGVSRAGVTAAGLEQLAGLLGEASRTAAQWSGFGRLDWQAGERNHVTLEGTDSDWNSPGGGLTRAGENYGNHSFGGSRAIRQRLMARWETYLTGNLMAVTQGSVSRSVFSAKPATPSGFEQTFLRGNSWGQLPQIVVDSSRGFTIGNPARFGQGNSPDERIVHAQELLDWAHGHTLIRSGFELEHDVDRTSRLRNQTGTYYYSSVASFISDALAFETYGYADALNPKSPHNCGTTAKTFGSQPCYSYYSQTMGPSNWWLSTNEWAGYVTAQWEPSREIVLSAGLRWERQQLPPAIDAVKNADLPFTEKTPSLGNNWGPRVSLAVGSAHSRWPVLRMGYGMFYSRVKNATLMAALTHTGSRAGDLNFFMRPSDDCQNCAGGAPPFPYVFAGEPAKLVKPGAVGFAENFSNPEVHQGSASIEQPLPGRVVMTAGAMVSLGRRLPVAMDTNLDPAVNPGTITYNVKDPTGKGPIKAAQIKAPFYASWPAADCPAGAELNASGQCGRLNSNYQQVTKIMSRANSTYEAATVRLARNGRRGLNFNAHYAYAHAMDWNPGERGLVGGNDVLDPADFSREYGTGNLDVRHTAAVTMSFEPPWKLHGLAGKMGNGWMLAGTGQYRSGLPYTMRVSGSIPHELTGNGDVIPGLGPSLNGSGGDNRVFGVGSGGQVYDIGRNTFRYPGTWKADFRIAKRFRLDESRQLELLAESFNLFNHRNVTQIETTGYTIENSSTNSNPTLCFLSLNDAGGASCGSPSSSGTLTPAFGQPLNMDATDFYRQRQIQLGLRMRF